MRSLAKTDSGQTHEETEKSSVLYSCVTSCDSASQQSVSLGVSALHGCRKLPNDAALCAAADLQNPCVGQADETAASCTGTDDGAGAACALNAAGDACSVLEDGYNCVFVAATTPVCDLDANTDGTAECPTGCTTTDISTDAAAQEAACEAVPDCTFVAARAPASCTGDNNGAGAACALNTAGDACNVLEDGNNCVFATGSACLWDIQAVCEAHVQTGDAAAQQEACEVDDRCDWHSDDYRTTPDESDCTVSSNQWEDSELQDPCTGHADEIAASCTGDNDGAGTGTACTLNAAGDACSVLEDGNNCVFVAATTPLCDLDASTDDTAECPAGCEYAIAYTPVCDLDDSTAPAGTADCPAGCVFVAETPNLATSMCTIDNRNSGQTSVPPTDLACGDTAPCVFSWNEPDFPACVPRECGSPTQTVERTVTCIAEASCTGTATDDAVDCADNFAAQTTKTADDCAAGCTYGAAERAQARAGGVLQPVTNSLCTDSEPASQYTCPAAPACTFALYPADWCGEPAPFCQTLPTFVQSVSWKIAVFVSQLKGTLRSAGMVDGMISTWMARTIWHPVRLHVAWRLAKKLHGRLTAGRLLNAEVRSIAMFS